MTKLFGTDGIRGLADKFPLDAATVSNIGRSLAAYHGRSSDKTPRFIIGRDTRESGARIERAFSSGAISGGAVCESAGIITTPGVAFLTGSLKFDAGIVISASHNPFEDNGLKVFLPSGQKLPRSIEEIIESEIAANRFEEIESLPVDDSKSIEYQELYLNHFSEDFGGLDLTGIRIVIDCANGAAFDLGPRLFEMLGADVVAFNNAPDGRNINRDCGSLHLEHLQQQVLEHKGDIGVAFDGDADRSLFVDEKGAVVDGDATLWIMSNYLRDAGKLNKDSVVATVMSNIGLEIALKKKSISLIRTDVGDKYVLKELVESSLSVGGEQSGHIIFPRRSLVGDGIQTALFVLDAMIKSGGSFSDLKSGFETFPQVLVNVKVKRKLPFEDVPEILVESKKIEAELGTSGRLLLRYSGTENLARVMIEGVDQTDIDAKANHLGSIIKSVLG